MLHALSAAAKAFSDALQLQVPLTTSIQKQMEEQITIADVIHYKSEMYALAESDKTGATNLNMVHADRSKFCKDKECAASLEQIDISNGWFAIISMVLIICIFVFCSALDTPHDKRTLQECIFKGIIPVAVGMAIVMFFFELERRIELYKAAIRERLLLDRIHLEINHKSQCSTE